MSQDTVTPITLDGQEVLFLEGESIERVERTKYGPAVQVTITLSGAQGHSGNFGQARILIPEGVALAFGSGIVEAALGREEA